MKKQLMIGAAVGALSLVSVAGIASAATATKPGSLASAIAAKFNLKTADVQSVIDTNHTSMEAYRDTKRADRIAAAVKAGTITQSQADVLTTKLAELEASRPAKLADGTKPTVAEMEAMKSKMEAFRTWAKDNNIPKNLIGMSHGGHGMHWEMMDSEAN